MKLVRQTSGVVGLLEQLPQGMRIVRKRPELIRKPHRIEGMDEVEKIYEVLDRPEEKP